jgi:hypothetical protein
MPATGVPGEPGRGSLGGRDLLSHTLSRAVPSAQRRLNFSVGAGNGAAHSHKYGNMVRKMKTTLEIPDFLFRRAKSVAAERGIPLRQFVTEAVQEKLKTTSQEKPWMKHLGKLKHLHRERRQIEKRVEAAFEQIDREVWE